MNSLYQKYPRIYRIYHGIKQRCNNPKNISYKYYGARGIAMCDEWASSFTAFCLWAINNGYSDCLTIERININEDYTPNNCIWVPLSRQAQNTRSNYRNRTITFNGETKTIEQWAQECNVTPRCLCRRIQRGMPVEKAVTLPRNQRGKYVTINGETKSVLEWCAIFNLSKSAYIVRVRHGMTPVQALTMPKSQGIKHTDRL